MKGILVRALLAVLSGIPALACPVCSGPLPQRTLDTYLGITLGLSLLPFALVGIGVLAFRVLKHSRGGEAPDSP